MRKSIVLSTAMALAAGTAAYAAEISDGKVKIGILNDQSGVYANFGGKYSYEAAKMAVEDFGGKVLDAPPTLPANGTTPNRSIRSWN